MKYTMKARLTDQLPDKEIVRLQREFQSQIADKTAAEAVLALSDIINLAMIRLRIGANQPGRTIEFSSCGIDYEVIGSMRIIAMWEIVAAQLVLRDLGYKMDPTLREREGGD
jgi:hypothetical protein